MPKRSNPISQANLRRGGGRAGIPNKATREIKTFWREFFESEKYRKSLTARMLRGDANHMETYLHALIYGRPRLFEDEMPIVQPGDSGPQIIFNLPRPSAEMTGRVTVVGAISMEPS